MVEIQQRAMEMERCELKAEAKKRHTIMYKITLLEKGIKISNPERFMWT
jgi:hypothetical protein